MSVAPLIARFSGAYAPALVLSVIGLRAAGTDAGSGSNLLVFLGCLFWATRPLKTGSISLEAPGSLGRALAGILLIDVLAQLAFVSYFYVQHGSKPLLLQVLPFVFITTVVVQGALAYDMLQRRGRVKRDGESQTRRPRTSA